MKGAALRGAALERECGGRLATWSSVPAARATTFGVGGAVELIGEPPDLSSLVTLLRALDRFGEPWRLLGAGSNIVLPDEGVSEFVLRLGQPFCRFFSVSDIGAADAAIDRLTSGGVLEEAECASEYVLALGAAPLMALSRNLCSAGLSGLEYAAGIPGTAGGAVRMNAGAHGRCTSEAVASIYALSPKGELRVYRSADLQFDYRSVNLPEHDVVAAVLFRLRHGEAKAIAAERSRCLQYRKETQPLQLPSAGSVFRNPSPDAPAGRLLEEAGLKGRRKGGVMFSSLHANWIVRVEESARAADVRALITLGQEEVERRFGISLQPEVLLW